MDDCITNSSNPECINFKLPGPRITENINKLCEMMPRMPGCYLHKHCNKEQGYCDPFSIWGDLCSDMPRMKGCEDYVSLCSKDSVVKQCQTKPLESLPSTRKSRELVKSICDEMDMTGCDTCMQDKQCDHFAVYLDLCKQMPEMNQCQDWKQMCLSDSSLPFCSRTILDSPTMKMYFHFGFRDYILFDFWIPSSGIEYLFAMLFCFGFAIFYEYLLHLNNTWKPRDVVRDVLDYEGQSSSSSSRPLLDPPINVAVDQSKKFQWTPTRIRLCRALMRLVTVSGAYICMLLVMSFNVGLFLSVVCGLAVGTFLWNDPFANHFQVEKEHCC